MSAINTIAIDLASSVDTILFDCHDEQWFGEVKEVAYLALLACKWYDDCANDVAHYFAMNIIEMYRASDDASDENVKLALTKALDCNSL